MVNKPTPTPKAIASSVAPVSGKETPPKSTKSASKDDVATTVAGGGNAAEVSAPNPPTMAAALAAKKAAPDSKIAPAPVPLSEAKPAVSGGSHQLTATYAVSGHPSKPASALKNSHEISNVSKSHGTVPDEHVTVQVKSKKKNWRGALDVGLKVLDSAMERAKKGENLEKSAGHDAPIVKGPVAGGVSHVAPLDATKDEHKETAKAGSIEAHKAVPTIQPAPKAPANTPTPSAKETRPKAMLKLSWKSPFKKRAASPPPSANEDTGKSMDDDDESESAATSPPIAISASATAQTTSSTKAAPATTLNQNTAGQPASRGFTSSYDDGSDQTDEAPSYANLASSGTPAGGAAPKHQNSQPEQSTAAAGVGAVGGAVGGAAGYSAYNDYQQGQDCPPPSPPSEDNDSAPISPRPELDDGTEFAPQSPPPELEPDTESGPPTPPPERDVDTDPEPASPLDDSPTPTPPPADEDDNEAGYTTYAFEQRVR